MMHDSLQKLGFMPRLIHVGFCVGQSGTGTGFSQLFSFILSVSFHHGLPYSYHLGDEQ
jgi:K+-transporting ATPase A subunit